MIRLPVGCETLKEGMEASSEYNLWTEDEISNDNNFDVIDYSPLSTGTESNVSISEFEVQDLSLMNPAKYCHATLVNMERHIIKK